MDASPPIESPMAKRRMTFGSFSGNVSHFGELRMGVHQSDASAKMQSPPHTSRNIIEELPSDLSPSESLESSLNRDQQIQHQRDANIRTRIGSKALVLPSAHEEDQQISGDGIRGRLESLFLGPKTSEFGMKTHSGVNVKKENQDTFFYVESLAGLTDTTVFGVFDGHGRGGAEAAQFAKQNLLKHLSSVIMRKESREEEIQIAFLHTQRDMENAKMFKLCGTTATICLVSGLYVYTAHVGDSRAILGRECSNCVEKYGPNNTHMNSFTITTDHKLDNMEERKRIEERGGLIARHPKVAHDCERIWEENKNYPGLVVTRTLGDAIGHKIGVSCEPEIRRKLLDKRDKVVVIASDGVWDVVTPQAAIDLVVGFEDPAAATETLVETCLINWKSKYSDGDNITAIVVFLGSLKRYDQLRSCEPESVPCWENVSITHSSSSSSKTCTLL